MRKILIFFLYILVSLTTYAQTDTIRYVKPRANGGAYTNDGLHWSSPKDNIQDAINDLRLYMQQNGLHSGRVYVAAGTYEPTEVVEGGTNGQLSTSFIIYPGIHVYGGFSVDNTDDNPEKPEDRLLYRTENGKRVTEKMSDVVDGDTTFIRFRLANTTRLDGNHNSSAETTVRWNSNRKRYDTSYPGNSYHVVFFASNGFINDPQHPGYADSLQYQASIDGFTIENGNAVGATDVRQGGRDHTSMGGGIYMVKNSRVENCIIQKCSAAMRGGGVYMDGGGVLVNSDVSRCQTLGAGVTGGYGGGVCIENAGSVRRSWITGNCGRLGGGIAVISYPENHPRGSETTVLRGDFDPFVSAVIVSNNTSLTEGGGIYLDRGGIVNHATIVRNDNVGRDITYGRTRYGRTGGVYIYGTGQVFNSVIWGNTCAANNDIQYAATTNTSISYPDYISSNLRRPLLAYTAMNNLDITNFTGTTRLNVYSFETVNNDPERAGNFPLFNNPTSGSGCGQGRVDLNAWYPFSKTPLQDKGVMLNADYVPLAYSVTSSAKYDFFHNEFNPVSTLGAIETGLEDIETANVAPVNPEDCGGSTAEIPTLFVDPNRIVVDPSATSGASWVNPLDNISEAIEYFRTHPQTGNFQILVKQGTTTCAGLGAFYSLVSGEQPSISLAAVRLLPNLKLYGGFPSTNVGTSTSGRNPKDYPTRITGDIISSTYRNNALHVVSFARAHDAVLDGFQLYYGNSRTGTALNSAAGGGAIVVDNYFFDPKDRVQMTGNVVRNCVLANSSGPVGGAVAVNSGYTDDKGITINAGLTLENCVINNCAGPANIVQVSGPSHVKIDHCTFVGNVANNGGSVLATTEANNVEGKIEVTNCAFHGNAIGSSTDKPSTINGIPTDRMLTLTSGNGITASNNLTDKDYTDLSEGFKGVFGFDSKDTQSYPGFANPVSDLGVAENTADNTVYGGPADYTPLDNNPMVNSASISATDNTTWGTDLTATVTRDYGGRPDVGALECHQGSDVSDGGQATFGTVIYVRDYNTYNSDGSVASSDTVTVGRDGMSWATAINGNAVYSSETTYSYNRTNEIKVSTSILAAENRYKLGLPNADPVCYANTNSTDNYIVNTSNQSDGDELIFLTATENTYYIYDVTRSKFIIYDNTSEGANNKVHLSDSNNNNATWRMYYNGDGTYGIVPGSNDNVTTETPGWNYYGGLSNHLGLYRISGRLSKWGLWLRVPNEKRGLQYAVDKASSSQNTYKPEVWVAQGYYTNKSTDQVNDQNYAFRMAEGVNVYGGFPRHGNPSMRERDPKAYVSVLQPQNIDPTDTTTALIKNSEASVARVLVQPNDFSTETSWNGFTIRYGYLQSVYQRNIQGNIGDIQTYEIGTSGGAGAYLMENGVLENCELLRNVILVDPQQGTTGILRIINGNDSETNHSGGYHQAGAGVYITTTNRTNGVGGTLKNCVVAYNELLHKFTLINDRNHSHPESVWMYGAGVYQDKGIVYNTIIHDNSMQVIYGNTSTSDNQVNEVLVGAGAFLVNGQFYNNTIVNNTAYGIKNGDHRIHVVIPGIYVYNTITMYNSIVSDNSYDCADNGLIKRFGYPICAFEIPDKSTDINAIYVLAPEKVQVLYSYIGIEKESDYNLCDTEDTLNTNIYLDYDQRSTVKRDAPYTSAQIYNASTFRLAAGSPCVNHGDGDIDGITIPSYDASYAARVQDCTIDIGAYEYNGAESITPRVTSQPNVYVDSKGVRQTGKVQQAEYFVNQNGNGDASARNPQNAACATKLQSVLDAAGRWKYAHPHDHVIIRLEALPDSAGYTPTRSAETVNGATANPRSYSFIVPMGVEIDGGWKTGDDFGMDKDSVLHHKDPINNVTRLTGEYASGTQTVNVYHVVTFTDQVFDAEGNPIEGEKISDKVEIFSPGSNAEETDEDLAYQDFSRSKLTGLYIEGGRAEGLTAADQNGAGAVLPGYAMISNCIVRDNHANGYGGAFYMLPGSAIQGAIIENNSAAYGGGVAVAEPSGTQGVGSWAFLLSNTITRNTATVSGGGLYFTNNARTWNSVYWNNSGAEQNDIAGVTDIDNAQTILNSPINFCAVTNQNISGDNNINLSPIDENGTRWGTDVNLQRKHDFDYYLPSRASVLSRAGMPYNELRELIGMMPGVDSLDIAGVSRIQYTAEDVKNNPYAYDGEQLVVKDNYAIEIGARALNDNFTITMDPDHPLYRLFVSHPENMNANTAQKLIDSKDATYSQEGSSFANPFLRLTDALNYIVDARKYHPEISRNNHFEIFLAEGTYTSHADMYGREDNVRSHTFVIPEGVSLYGGIDAANPNNQYCQDTTRNYKRIVVDNTDITLIGACTDSIRLKRERYDLNQNSVVEPWEMAHPTVLSGYTEGSDFRQHNVYHVIVSIGDPNVVGELPTMYSDDKLTVETDDGDKESYASRGNRAIIIDGVTVEDGAAVDYESTVYNHNYYFRGGGIFVSGNDMQDGKDGKAGSDMRRGTRNIPLVISNSLFQNNTARLGGAIFSDGAVHIVGSSFVQNLAESPSSSDTEDLKYVTFSGGGAIATNNALFATNTIFANNEARDNGGTIVIDQDGSTKRMNVSITEEIDSVGNTSKITRDANEIRGYGGAIWAGDNAAVRLINCNSVRNKAHAYASLYNCQPNVSKTGEGHQHFGVNCIFWGNQVDAGKDSLLMHYENNRIGGLYFSAYQEGKGLPVTVDPNKPDSTYQKKIIYGGYETILNLDTIMGGYNHNIIINDDNNAIDGPNFTLPSNEAGVAGYMPSADWVPSRINRLCDAGWGSIKQNTQGEFLKQENMDLDNREAWFINGVYGLLADFYMREFNITLLPQGPEKYMMYANDNGTESSRNMDRISSDPLGTVTRDFIDIGVYEYQHTMLQIADGKEVDELWVSDDETTGDNSGLSIDNPTSDLQRAIQTLLQSRNNHPKTIHIMEGTYTPIYELDGNNYGFQIHNLPSPSTAALRDSIPTGTPYQATSITFLGGYSKTIKGERDVNKYPTVFRMVKRTNSTDANVAHLFYIGDAEQWQTEASYAGDQSITRTSMSTGKAMPIVFDGITFINPYANKNHRDIDDNGGAVSAPYNGSASGGAAIYYREQHKTRGDSINVTNNNVPGKSKDFLDAMSDAPKLTIRNCKFEENGDSTSNDVPAVFIGKGGGKTVVYNSLFDYNNGAPIVSYDGIDIVNCTFAQNSGHVTVKGDAVNSSTLSNSILWEKPKIGEKENVQQEGFQDKSVSYNAIYGIVEANDKNHNVSLSGTNNDPMNGPNFLNVNSALGQPRDFSLNPGMKTMNRADSVLYKQLTSIFRKGVKVLREEGKTDSIEVLKPENTMQYDLSWGARKYGEGLDIGAYECRVKQQRILYVRPSQPTNTTGTEIGSSWENYYGDKQLQTAIDAAAIYASNNGNKRAYVLVKGESNNSAVQDAITLRDNVSIYGSIPENFLTSMAEDDETDDGKVGDYITNMLKARPGIAARSARRSRIAGINTSDDDSYSNGALLDGFEVRSSARLAGPVVNITKPVVLSKLIIDGNNTTNGKSVIDMEEGLLYNSLVYSNVPLHDANNTQPMMTLGKDAAVLNSTIVSDSIGVKALGGSGFLANSITFGLNNRTKDEMSGDISRDGTIDTCHVNKLDGIPFAPYLMSDVNVINLSSYITDFRPYIYQLHENSYDIAGGDDELDDIISKAGNDVVKSILTQANSKDWINFKSDQDILGNKRFFGSHIDRGCFETWYVAKGTTEEATADNYPHEGSVVYIMEGANLNLGKNGDAPIYTSVNPFKPAFLLMRDGASLYGNGNTILIPYMATEKTIEKGGTNMLVSLPYRYKISDAVSTSFDSSTGQISAQKYTLANAQTYNGQKRSAWDYHFEKDNSNCWEPIDQDAILAPNTGWLATLQSHDDEDVTLRFAGAAERDGDYVYEEYGTPKTVTLTQYDENTNNNSAHFTKAENMGWNIMGLPFLVSNYNTGVETDADDANYPMNVPHVIYTMSNKGVISTEQSWDKGVNIRFGQGLMTQTAIIPNVNNGGHETVTFALPVPETSNNSESSAKPLITIGSEGGMADDVLRLDVSQTAKTLQYNLGSDGVKWLPMNKELPSIYAVSASGTSMSLASATPVETDIPIVVGGNVTDSTVIAIADTAGFSKVSHVWLKNNDSGEVVDLKDQPLHTYTTRSFTLRLGGMRPDGTKDNSADGNVHIYVTGRTLHVDGLRANDSVGVYTISGQLYKRGQADDNSYSCELNPGVYVVRAGGKGQAVAVR